MKNSGIYYKNFIYKTIMHKVRILNSTIIYCMISCDKDVIYFVSK